MTFKLTVTLGNAAMQTTGDVAEALRDVATYLDAGLTGPRPIRDANGATVGRWEIAS